MPTGRPSDSTGTRPGSENVPDQRHQYAGRRGYPPENESGRQGGTAYFLFRHRLADDTIRDVEVCSGPVTIEGRKLLYSLVHDITERKSADEALRFEREQLFSMFDSMETYVYVADPFTHEILYTNKALESAIGKPVAGGICHREFQGLEAPCPFCTNEIILRQYPAPHHWEYRNPKLGRGLLRHRPPDRSGPTAAT